MPDANLPHSTNPVSQQALEPINAANRRRIRDNQRKKYQRVLKRLAQARDAEALSASVAQKVDRVLAAADAQLAQDKAKPGVGKRKKGTNASQTSRQATAVLGAANTPGGVNSPLIPLIAQTDAPATAAMMPPSPPAVATETRTEPALRRGDSAESDASLDNIMDVFVTDWASASVSDRSESSTEAGSSGRG